MRCFGRSREQSDELIKLPVIFHCIYKEDIGRKMRQFANYCHINMETLKHARVNVVSATETAHLLVSDN